MNDKPSLQKRVDEALDAAIFENGYAELMEWEAGAVTVDLLDDCPDLEDEREDLVLPCVEDYMRWYWERPGVARMQPRSQ